MLKLKVIRNQILHVEASTQAELALSFLRFQEYYESPRFRGKFFSIKEFKDWYRKKYGRFSYASDWAGFNVPSYVFDPFLRGQFGRLSRLEKRLLKLIGNQTKPFYVIGTYKNSDGCFDHEFSHALYHTNLGYKKRVNQILNGLNLKPLFRYFKKLGYASNVFMDEAHAYLTHDVDSLQSDGINLKPYLRQIKALKNNYKKFKRC